jgi:alpha-N-arabinofuranosidase
MVFLGTRPVGYPHYHLLGRETFLAPVTWQDGWPVVGNRGTVDLEMDAPLPASHPSGEAEVLWDDFDSASLGFHWNWLRNPDPARYSLSARPGWLRLIGGEPTLNDSASPTFLGRRQRHLKCRVTTRMDFHPKEENEEAGLVVLGDNHHHYEIGITCQAGNRVIFVQRKVGTLQAVVAQQPLPEGQVQLRVDADEAWYTFRYAIDNERWLELARGESRYMSSESGAAIFTGTYFGMYATGNGRPCQAPADFDSFEYKIMEGPEE